VPRIISSRPNPPPGPDAEPERIARYEHIQRQVCETANAPYVPADYSKHVWLGPLIAEGHKLVYGERYAETDGWSGWSLTADDRPKPEPTEIRFEHLRHLVSVREDLMPYLGLPVDWTFSIFGDGSWHSWSPKDRLLTWLDNFISGREATRDDATAIAELIGEHFEGTELGTRVVEPIVAWASRDGRSPGEVRELLSWASDWLRSNPAR
jgi:hypothetical protein